MLSKWRTYRRLPWVRVADGRDCGASAFASIACYYRHHLSLEQARALVGTDRDGTTLAGLRDGGRAIGLEARPAEAIYAALEHVQLPAIVHLEDREGHYVVLYQWSPEAVIVLDPNRGLRRITREQFEAQWSGYVVEYRPTPRLRPRISDFRTLPLVMKLIKPHRRSLLLGLLAALLATSLGWASSFFLRTLIDNIVPNQRMSLLLVLGSGLLLVSAFQALLQFGRLWLMAQVGRTIHSSYGVSYLDHLMSLPMQVFDGRCIPNLVMRTNQVEAIQQAVSDTLVTLITDLLMFAVALGIILFYDPVAALIALAAVPLILSVMVVLNDRIYDAQLNAIVQSDELAGHLVGVFDGIRNIKIFSAEERYKRFLTEKFNDLTRARYESRVAMMLPMLWGLFAASLVISAVLWYGGARILAGQITAGELIVIFGMIVFYLNPVQRLPTLLLGLRGALISLKRLEDILHLPPEATAAARPPAEVARQGQIEFDRVSFAYKRHRPVLRNVSFTIRPGETVAIVGETGSGKSSIANLIAGFYFPSAGDVRIDGVSTRQIPPAELRRSISAVFQGQPLFQQSVLDNITMMQDVPTERVEQVAELANAATFINALHKGYQSQVSRSGDNFSSGQAQRIALARALLKDAPILILDEATSNLDGATEQGIIQALDQQRDGRTMVVIAHRLSTVMHADRILVVHQGEIVEAGTHEELMQQQGWYIKLFGWQVSGGRPVADRGELVE